MPIQFTCPVCSARARVSDYLSGLSFACPSCKATVLVPDASGVAAPLASSSFEQRERVWSAPAVGDSRWEIVRTALRVEMIAAGCLLLWLVLGAIVGGAQVLRLPQAPRLTRGTMDLIDIAASGWIGATIAVLLLLIVSRAALLAVPRESGAKLWATVCAVSLFLTLVVAGCAWIARAPGSDVRYVVLGLALAAQIAFLLSLRRLALHFGHKGQALHSMVFLVVFAMMAVARVSLPLLLRLSYANRPLAAWVPTGLFVLEITGSVVLVGWYFILIRQERRVFE